MELEVQLFLYKVLLAVIGILLLAAGVVDIRRKQISKRQLVILLLVCLAVIPLKDDFRLVDAVGGLSIGLCAVGLSIATGEQIGRGDGIVIAIVGLALGFRQCLLVVCTAVFLMCAAAIHVLIFRKGGRQTRLAFLPAVFAGYVVCVIL